jgi:hypothetical protein
MTRTAGSSIVVSPAPSQPRKKGEHWIDGTGKGFRNPWPSFSENLVSLVLILMVRDPDAHLRLVWSYSRYAMYKPIE